VHTVAFLALTLPVSAPALKDKPPPGPPVVGRWQCTALTIDGAPNPQWQGLEYEFTADGKWVIYRDGRVLDDRARTYKLDPKAGAGAIDVDEGVPERGAFRVEKDTLQLAIHFGGGDRPARPEATGKGIMTFTFERVKGGK
jgi:uncharacterized protein (TIGR03067 family)